MICKPIFGATQILKGMRPCIKAKFRKLLKIELNTKVHAQMPLIFCFRLHFLDLVLIIPSIIILVYHSEHYGSAHLSHVGYVLIS